MEQQQLTQIVYVKPNRDSNQYANLENIVAQILKVTAGAQHRIQSILTFAAKQTARSTPWNTHAVATDSRAYVQRAMWGTLVRWMKMAMEFVKTKLNVKIKTMI